jgi:two-component system response regulator (stage 0 sporulation protein A)
LKEVLKVMFADDNRDYCEIISDYFSAVHDIEIVGIAKDGSQAYEMIIQNEPDIVVLDMIMPYMDGLGVIEKLKANSLRKMPLIIILSAIGQENITQNAISLGAQYYFIKPFNLELLAERIRQLGSTIKNISNNGAISTFKRESDFIKKESQLLQNDIERNVTRLIREVGVPAHIKGYQFLRDAIIMVVNDMDAISSITKLLYPAIAKRYNTTSPRVERAIRHAVEVVWERGETDVLKRIFGYTVVATMERPSNSEFIATISDTLRLEMKRIW